jgi:ribonuclease-3
LVDITFLLFSKNISPSIVDFYFPALKILSLFRSQKNKIFAKKIKNITGYKPVNLNLYKLALTHKAATQKYNLGVIKNDNERLEFLGDAVLDLAIADIVFNKFPLKDEGFLTEMRSKIVSRQQLNNISNKMALTDLIEMKSTGKDRFVNHSIGGNALEALIGALYLDKGYNKTLKFVNNKLIEGFLDLKEIESSEISFKGKIYEFAQKSKKELKFEIANQFKKDKNNFFEINLLLNNEVVGNAIHHSKKKAEEIASEKACILLQEQGLMVN